MSSQMEIARPGNREEEQRRRYLCFSAKIPGRTVAFRSRSRYHIEFIMNGLSQLVH